MKILLAVLLALALAATSRADSYSFKMGLGIIDKPTSEIKSGAVRHESDQFLMIKDATEFGLWSDIGKSKGRKSAAYVQYQLGIRPESQNMYMKAFIGPSLISTTDSQLGGIFQFAEDVGFGFQDRDSFIGLNYSHKSSAGIFKPNKGRDFLSVEMGVKF